MASTQQLDGWRLRAFFAFAGLIARLGFVPTADKIASLPLAKRKANRAPGWQTEPLPADVQMRLDTIAGRGGPIVIKTYLPPRLLPESPRVLFLHGGGWITGGVDTLDHLCANVSRDAQCRVVSVDYRLAPETPFPGGLEDCHDALLWLAKDASLGPPPASGIVVMGESAGANLAAALCVLNARLRGPAISHQVLLYPLVDATLSSPSIDIDLPGLERKNVVRLIDIYRGTAELTDPLLSPIFAENHAALPPALIITADIDPARDDGARYARTLSDAGVPVKYVNYPGMPHAFFFMPRICKAAAQGIAEISAVIRALAKGAPAKDRKPQ